MSSVIPTKIRREPLPTPGRRRRRPQEAPAGDAPRARREPRAPRVSHAFIARLLLVLLGLVGGGALLSGLLVGPGLEPLRGRGAVSPEERELTEILERLRAAWDARERARILAEAEQHAWRLAGPLHRILRQRDHALLEPAVEYAGAVGVPELRPAVAALALAGDMRVRPPAILAAERLGPWPPEQLALFLEEGKTPVQVAALRVVSDRTDAPWRQAFALLLSPDAGVREAALAAVPRHAPAEAVAELWTLVQFGSAAEAAVGLRALARTDAVETHEDAVADLLGRADPEVQKAALEMLGAPGRPLRRAAAVRALAENPGAELRVRAAALWCLERTESHDVEELRSLAAGSEPLLKYFAARGLVTAGDGEGARALLELLDENDVEIVMATRRLLAALTGSSPGASAETFRAGLAGERRRYEGALPPPPP